jgi:hypothetical protein
MMPSAASIQVQIPLGARPQFGDMTQRIRTVLQAGHARAPPLLRSKGGPVNSADWGGRGGGREETIQSDQVATKRKSVKLKRRGALAERTTSVAASSSSSSLQSLGDDINEIEGCENADLPDDETAAGATAFTGYSGQHFRQVVRMQEDRSRATRINMTLLLTRQYEHQLQLERVLNDCVGYPQCATNLIGEFLYTHSILDSY